MKEEGDYSLHFHCLCKLLLWSFCSVISGQCWKSSGHL